MTDLGVRWAAAITALDMAVLLDPADPEVRAAALSARAVMEELGATPFLARLDAALAGSDRAGRRLRPVSGPPQHEPDQRTRRPVQTGDPASPSRAVASPVTHEYALLVGGLVLPGGTEPDATALAWAGGTVLAIGSDADDTVDLARRLARGGAAGRGGRPAR